MGLGLLGRVAHGLRRALGRPPGWAAGALGEGPELTRFDGERYLRLNPEVARLVEQGRFRDAADHFFRVGSRHGLDPNVWFREGWYRERFADVRAGIDSGGLDSGFHHFVIAGWAEGRPAGPVTVLEPWYLETYPDARAAVEEGRVGSALEHYLLVGAGEGRDPNPAFHESWYRRTYRDEVEASLASGHHVSGFHHFVEEGWRRGFRPHPDFSEGHYRELHPDVDEQVASGRWPSGYAHLVEAGLREGRRWRRLSPLATLREHVAAVARCDLDELLRSDRVLDLTPAGVPEVSVVLVLHNRAELTLQCLESLLASVGPSLEVVVVDNASTDETATLLERVRGVEIVRSATNLGFNGGCGLGAERARGEALLFLNNDARVRPGAIAAALARLRGDDAVGAVGGRIVRLDGRLEEAGQVVWNDGSTLPYGAGDDPASGAYLFPRPVDCCCGAFLLVDRSAFARLGGFNPDFAPAYYEDVDLCLRLSAELGLATVYEPGAVVHHFGSASVDDRQTAEDQSRVNQRRLAEAHGELLAGRPAPSDELTFAFSCRGEERPRVLVAADDLPGAGSREEAVVDALQAGGAAVTVVTTRRRSHPLEPVPWETICHLGLEGFGELWRQRRKACRALVVVGRDGLERLTTSGVDLDRVRLVLVRRAGETGGDDLAGRVDAEWAPGEDLGRVLSPPDQGESSSASSTVTAVP